MSGIFKSLRIMTGQNTLKMTLQMLAILVGLNVISCGLALITGNATVSSDNPALAEVMNVLATDFIPYMSMFIPALGLIFINLVYNCNIAAVPGYRYFHCIKNGEQHFKQAIIAANLMVILFSVLGTVVFLLVNLVVYQMTAHVMIIFIICFAGAGLMNFMGYIKNTIAKIVMLMPLYGGAGFLVGFFMEGTEEPAEIAANETALYIISAIAVAIFAAGLIFSLIKCKKAWRADK